VETVAQALKLRYVAITLRAGDRFHPVAAFGVATAAPTTLPLLYQGEPVGQLLLAPRSGEGGVSPADRRLLDDLARQAGIACHAVLLTADLQRSRERLVTTREEERRRLRRDLHDGLGPALASLTLKLDAARNLLRHDPEATDRLLCELKGQVQGAIADIRRLVYALRPPTLDELGLASAIREQAKQYENSGLRITVEAPEDPHGLPAAVEVAAYRIAQEALTNVVRHAHARTCTVRLEMGDVLSLEITDDGCGLNGTQPGVGLSSMRERAEELGGTCVIGPGAHGGTCVLARLPVSHAPARLREREGDA
jgi:signal transduction histidine kinase